MLGDDSEDADDMSDNPNDGTDNADTDDADILEMLGESDRPAATIPEQATSNELPVSDPALESSMDNDIPSEAANIESSASVVIDPFPYGSPGAPISRGSHMDGTDCEASDNFIWAPFNSQCDWELAHWAKMRGPTSSAMAELLATKVRLVFL